MRAGPLATSTSQVHRGLGVPGAAMLFPWCCGAGKEGIFRWRRAPERRPEVCLADCLEQLSALLALPEIPSDDGPQGFRMLEDLHRLLRDVHIQVERALSERSANGAGGSSGSRCPAGVYSGAGAGDVSTARDGCNGSYTAIEALCIRCARVPATLCMTCAQDPLVSMLPVFGGLRNGHTSSSKCCAPHGSASNDVTASEHGCARPALAVGAEGQSGEIAKRKAAQETEAKQTPNEGEAKLQADEAAKAVIDATSQQSANPAGPAGQADEEALARDGRHGRQAPQQFYIGDDEAWRCDDVADSLPLVTGGAWRSDPGLPAPPPKTAGLAAVPERANAATDSKCDASSLWGNQAGGRGRCALPAGGREVEEDDAAERIQLVSQLRRHLHGLSEHSRHLLTVPITNQATDRTSSSAGGTFREFLHACTSEDMVLFPPSCLEAHRRVPEGPGAEAGAAAGMSAEVAANGVDGQGEKAQAKPADDIAAALKQLPLPMPMPPVHTNDDDEDCDCERYAVSRQRDGRLIWSPEPLPAG